MCPTLCLDSLPTVSGTFWQKNCLHNCFVTIKVSLFSEAPLAGISVKHFLVLFALGDIFFRCVWNPVLGSLQEGRHLGHQGGSFGGHWHGDRHLCIMIRLLILLLLITSKVIICVLLVMTALPRPLPRRLLHGRSRNLPEPGQPGQPGQQLKTMRVDHWLHLTWFNHHVPIKALIFKW